MINFGSLNQWTVSNAGVSFIKSINSLALCDVYYKGYGGNDFFSDEINLNRKPEVLRRNNQRTCLLTCHCDAWLQSMRNFSPSC